MLVAGMLIGFAAAARAEELDAAKVQALSGEPAGKVTFRGDWMRFAKLTDLSPEVAVAGLAALRSNPRIELPKAFGQAK